MNARRLSIRLGVVKEGGKGNGKWYVLDGFDRDVRWICDERVGDRL